MRHTEQHYFSQSHHHKDLSPSRIIRHENNTQSILTVLRESFVDPFSDQCLLSISTGIAIDEKASGEILSAFEIGSKAMETFIAERLLEGSERSIFDPIKRLKLATFDNLNKKQIAKTKNKTISLQTSKDLFSKVANITQKRSVDLKGLFAYPLAHLPLSPAEPDGTLKKTAKS